VEAEQPGPTKTQPLRLGLLALTAMLLAAAIVYLVLNTPAQRTTSASAQFDRLVRKLPTQTEASAAFSSWNWDYMGGSHPATNTHELTGYVGKSIPAAVYGGLQQMLSFNPSRNPAIGRIIFKDRKYDSSRNLITGEHHTSASLAATGWKM
jgi:hypothetical protein